MRRLLALGTEDAVRNSARLEERRTRHGGGSRGAIAGWCLLVAALVSLVPTSLAQESADAVRARTQASAEPAPTSLSAALSGTEILRCHFDEKRLVVRHRGKLHVVHEGEALPDGGLRVERMDGRHAVLVKGRSFQASGGGRTLAVPQEMVVLTLQPDGSVSTTSYLDHDPDAVTARLASDVSPLAATTPPTASSSQSDPKATVEPSSTARKAMGPSKTATSSTKRRGGSQP
jgi:hypothetical protein